LNNGGNIGLRMIRPLSANWVEHAGGGVKVVVRIGVGSTKLPDGIKGAVDVEMEDIFEINLMVLRGR
jgi:hypothetical protein